MFVLTADQRASTRHGDRVERVLESLAPWAGDWRDAVLFEPERTVGDEIQAVMADADAAVDLAMRLMRLSEWSVGIGVGSIDAPLGATARASSGSAFVNARRAVERARGRKESVPLVVAGLSPESEEPAHAVMQLLASVVRRRSAAGWEVHDLALPGVTQREIAARLNITDQAVSQRVASAMLDEERSVRPVAAALLRLAERGEGLA
jgi:hypothetical protein